MVFGVSNAKYLTFDTPDENALIGGFSSIQVTKESIPLAYFAKV